MIALYLLLLNFLKTVRFVFGRRAKSLEKKFTRLSLSAKMLASKPVRSGNSNRADACVSARRQYELGRLVHKRDRVERKYFTWQNRYETVARGVNALRGWNGRKLPYVCGIIDVSLVLVAIHLLGLATIDFSELAEKAYNAFASGEV